MITFTKSVVKSSLVSPVFTFIYWQLFMTLTRGILRHLFRLTAIAILAVCAAQPAFSSQEPKAVLRYNLGGTQSWVPYGYFGDPDRPGIFAEVIELILQRTGDPYQFYYYPPKRAGKAFKEGRLDLDFMSPSWFKNGDMGDEYVTTTTIFSLTEYVVTLPDNASRYSKPECIEGKRVGTVAGYNYYDEDKFTRVDFLSESALVEGLKKRRFDMVILEGITAQYWANVYKVPISLASVHSQGGIVIRIRKQLSYLLPEFNSAIEALKREGKIEKILQSYDGI